VDLSKTVSGDITENRGYYLFMSRICLITPN
jgi:hypothetical protein